MNKLILVATVSVLWTGTLWAQATKPSATTAPAATHPTTASQPTAESQPTSEPAPEETLAEISQALAKELELSSRQQKLLLELYVHARQYQNLATELDLSDRQQKALLELWKRAHDPAIAWEKANDQTIKDLRDQMVEAYREGEKETVKTLKAQIAKFDKERYAMIQQFEKGFKTILSPNQKQQYAALEVAANAMRPYASLQLTDRQQDVIKGKAAKAQVELAKAGEDKAKIDAIYDALYKDIENNVLNDDQKKALKGPTTKPATAPATTGTTPKPTVTGATPKR